MKKLTGGRRRLLLLCFTVLPFAVLTIAAPPLYILNDDLQIASVLSGAYSGTPDLHTVYMRAPLSFFLSLFYRILPSVPWFGIFLCGTVVLCAYLLLRSAVGEAEDAKQLLLSILPVWGAELLFLVLLYWQPHYTVVAACTGAAALFLLIRAKEGETMKERLWQLLPVFLLLLLCDQIRSQVFFMLLPFLGMALFFVFSGREKKGMWLKKEAPLWMGFAVVWLGLFGLHQAAYAGAEWQEYRRLNQARTALYDYTLVWESDAAREYYKNCGVTEEAYPLYLGYDLLPDLTITTERLQKMADFQEPSRAMSAVQRAKEVLRQLAERTLKPWKNGDLPYAWLLIVLYAVAFVGIFRKKKYLLLLPLFGSGILHFAIYGWLLWQGRAPQRVTLSLYLAESFLLLAVILVFPERKIWGKLLLSGVMALALLPAARDAISVYRKQSSVNQCDDVVYSYMAAQPQELFLLDTFATVYRTVPVFQRNDTEKNSMLMGGWMYGSPLQTEKLREFGYPEVRDLFAGRGVYCIFRKIPASSDAAKTELPEEVRDLDRYLEVTYGSELQWEDTVRVEQSGEDAVPVAEYGIYRIVQKGDSGSRE